MSEWREHRYHTYVIRGTTRPDSGDLGKWVGEVYVNGALLLQFRLTIFRTQLVILAHLDDENHYLEQEGLLRLHAWLDFGEFAAGVKIVHEHKITASGEEIDPPFREAYHGLFVSQDERLTYHILKALRRLRYETYGHLESSSFDMSAWAYYLAVPEESIGPVLRRLDQERAINATWVPSPKMTGAYQLAGGLGIRVEGLDYLEELESELALRRRTAAMPDIGENAFKIARYMRDNNFVGANYVLGAEIRKALALSPDEFDAADDYLRETGFCEGVSGGDSAQLILKAPGVTFVSEKLAERLDLSNDAELLARYLASKQDPGKTFSIDTEIKTDLAWDDNRYWQAAQILVDEELADEKPHADNAPLKGLSLNPEGRKAVRRNFRRQMPPISVHTGDKISVESSGPNTAIAAGRGANVTQGLSGSEVALLFQNAFRQLEQQADLPNNKKREIQEVIELVQGEAEKGEAANEKALGLYFRTLASMAPDILDVVIAAATNPMLAAATIAKKVADKAKADTQNKGTG